MGRQILISDFITEEFDYTKGVTRIDRQHNGQEKKDKRKKIAIYKTNTKLKIE